MDNNNESKDKNPKLQTLSIKSKWTLTGAIYICFFIFGMGVSFNGPALLDIADQIKSDIDDISTKASVPSSITSLIAAIAIGYLLKFINRQWFMILSYTISAIGCFWTSNAGNIVSLAFSFSISGISYMGIDVSSNAWLLAIWRGGSTHILQGLHFTWAFGSAIAPLIMAPYLSIKSNISHVEYNETINMNITSYNISQTESHFHGPYYAAGILNAACAVTFVCLYFIIRYDESNESADSDANTKDTAKFEFSKVSSATVIGLAIATICAIEGAEVSTQHFTPAMIAGLGFTKAKGAYMSSARAFVYAFSRVFAAYAATKVSIKIILLFSFFLVIGSNVIIIIASNIVYSSMDLAEGLLWIGFCLLGLGYGPIHPGIMSYAESYVKLNNFSVGLFVSVGSANIILNFLVVGHWIESMPIIMIYYGFVCETISLSLFIALIVFINKTAKLVDRGDNGIDLSGHQYPNN